MSEIHEFEAIPHKHQQEDGSIGNSSDEDVYIVYCSYNALLSVNMHYLFLFRRVNFLLLNLVL